MQRILLIVIGITLILFAIYYRAYIIYFFRLIKARFEQYFDIKKIKQQQSVKKFLLKKKDTKKYVELANKLLKEKDYKVKSEYKINAYLEQKLKFSKLDDNEQLLIINKFVRKI